MYDVYSEDVSRWEDEGGPAPIEEPEPGQTDPIEPWAPEPVYS